MRSFLIMTSRGSSTRLEIDNDDDDITVHQAIDVAAAVYRPPRSWQGGFGNNIATGIYQWNGEDIRIVVIDADRATATEAVNAVAWMNEQHDEGPRGPRFGDGRDGDYL